MDWNTWVEDHIEEWGNLSNDQVTELLDTGSLTIVVGGKTWVASIEVKEEPV